MTLKLGEIVGAEKQIETLLDLKFPVKVSYKIKRLADKIQPELKAFREKNLELFKKYGTHDPEKDVYTLDIPENHKVFNKEFAELLEVEVNLDFEKIKIADLGDTLVEPKTMVEWMFEE